jgi:hypothetical protein
MYNIDNKYKSTNAQALRPKHSTSSGRAHFWAQTTHFLQNPRAHRILSLKPSHDIRVEPHGVELSCPQGILVLVIDQHKISLREHPGMDRLIVLGLDSFLMHFILLKLHLDIAHRDVQGKLSILRVSHVRKELDCYFE